MTLAHASASYLFGSRSRYYWAYDDDFGYYWVPGTWIEPPRSGLLWTPGYWGFDNGNYVYYDGYWGDQVGFYGGVYYGFGYTGFGYEGGYWQGGNFFYNSAVNNITAVNITNVYSKTVIINTTVNRVSYNGGEGGLAVPPTEQQQAFAHQQHIGPTALQREHVQMASRDPTLARRRTMAVRQSRRRRVRLSSRDKASSRRKQPAPAPQVR